MYNQRLKEAITRAFKKMRAQGFIAKQAFSCCMGCAGYEIATRVKEMDPSRQAKVKGCITYNQQDASIFRERPNRWADEPPKLFISYGPVQVWGDEGGGTKTYKEYGLPTAECGKLLKETLEAEGLEVIWDGDPDTRIACRMKGDSA